MGDVVGYELVGEADGDVVGPDVAGDVVGPDVADTDDKSPCQLLLTGCRL